MYNRTVCQMMKAAVYGTAAFMHQKNMIYHINVLQSNEDMTVKLAWTSKNDCVTMHTMHCNERRVSGGSELRKLIVFLAALLFLLPASAEIYIDQEPPSD